MDRDGVSAFFPRDALAASVDLPMPKLQHDFRMSVNLNPKIELGEGPWGNRNWISFSGGNWKAGWGSGTVEPGGQDSQLVDPDTLATFLDTSYLLKTSDEPPAYIAIKTSGWRTGPRHILEKLFDPAQADAVGPGEYSFRAIARLETGDQRYKDKLNTGLWVCSGARGGNEVAYDAYRII